MSLYFTRNCVNQEFDTQRFLKKKLYPNRTCKQYQYISLAMTLVEKNTNMYGN